MNNTINWNELHANLKAEVERVGYFYISDRPLSVHPDDWYLRCVLGFKMIGERTEYVTWVYNADRKPQGSLNSGHYIEDRQEAYDDYLGRR